MGPLSSPQPPHLPPDDPLLPSSPHAQTLRLLTVSHVPPFSDRSAQSLIACHLLWRLLTSESPSRRFTASVAAIQQRPRSPRVRRVTFTLIPAAYTAARSVQVSDFEELCLLIPRGCLVCDSCSSGQCFAYSFLQIPSRDGHPCLRLAVPLVGPAADFHRQVIQPATTANQISATHGASRHAWRT